MSTEATNTSTGEGTRRRRFDRRLLAGLVVAAAAAAVLAQSALAGLQPPAGNRPYLVGHGVGVQIYSCDGATWKFVAPRADLLADNGRLIISHFGGPSWRFKDGSTVVGTVVDKVTVDESAIPWLLLSASPAPGSHPGRLDHTTFIQRINTTGGLQPHASDCTAAAAGTQVEVPYTADYVFWR